MVPYLIIAAVALQRLIEVGYARRNTRALLMRGGIEVGRRHYPLFVLLHAAWLLAILVALPEPPVIALIFSVLNAMLLAWRVHVEEGVLRERMVPQTYPPSIPSGHLPPQGREAEERNGC